MVKFATNKTIHLPKIKKGRSPHHFNKKDIRVYPIKWYTDRDYDLWVLRKRPNIIREYFHWTRKKKILYATCLIIGEEGGIYWDYELYKPSIKSIELIDKHKLIGIKENENILFMCGPPEDYIYEKLQEDSMEWMEHVNYGKYTPPKKHIRELICLILFILLITIIFSIILGLKCYFIQFS